jgi:hypothetical protein
MAVHVIASSLMTSDSTRHRARSVGQEHRVVCYLPGRTRARAGAALRIAEVVPPLLDAVGELVDEVGLVALEAVGMAARQSRWDERPARHPGRLRTAARRTEVA